MNIFLPPLRPPGALDEENFLRLCIRCGQCVEVCPHGSLKFSRSFGAGRLAPLVDPVQNPCYLCMKCPPVCPTGALDPQVTDMGDANMGRAWILENLCHNFTDGVMCWTCYDKCPLRGRAIILAGGITPEVTGQCVGCGVCANVCPKQAVEIVPRSRAAHIPPNAVKSGKKS